MIEGYQDLQAELCEILGGDVTAEDVDAAVDALVNEEHVTATAALGELNTLAQSEEGKAKLRSMLADWIMHERKREDVTKENSTKGALNHLLAALGAERRTHSETVGSNRRG
ncbi:MAG TPA: hypothetical protein VLR47_09255 [Rhodospirillales bacterium]|nr:hypothetical protein [Rhodospirillales bacterium]